MSQENDDSAYECFQASTSAQSRLANTNGQFLPPTVFLGEGRIFSPPVRPLSKLVPTKGKNLNGSGKLRTKE